LARLGHDEIGEFEPNARGVAALHSPSTGVVDFARVASTLADDVREHDGAVITDCGVHSAQPSDGSLIVKHDRGELRTGFAVFCAGAWSDRLALRCGARLDYRILPFRGAYLQLRTERSELVRGLIYPVPDPRLPFLGVHISRHIDGKVTIGPTALPVFSRTAYRLRKVRPTDVVDSLSWPGTWRMAGRWWRTGLTEIADAVSRRALVTKARAYVPALEVDDFTQQSEVGIRAQAVARDGTLLDDFVFARTPRALHVCNAPSPAATASLALAEHIVEVVQRTRGST
jgi:2-hydroxyglutarate dehydrogenase